MASETVTAATDLDGHDRRSLLGSRPPSPSPSNRSTTSTTSTVRRQKIIQLQLEAAEQRAMIERQLLEEKLAIQTRALEEEEELPHVNGSRIQSHTSLLRTQNAGTSSKLDTRNIDNHHKHQDKHTSAFVVPNLTSSQALEHNMCKFLARQTSAKELPLFSGEPEEWPLFYSTFISTTQLCEFTDEENIARLQRCLRGRARDAVSALLVTASNLENIISTLKLRFGRPQFIIEIMLNKIRNIRDIRHDDINQLIEFATHVQNIVATMKITEEVGHLANPTLIKEIINKLPSTLKFQWSFHISNSLIKNVTLSDVSDWLMMVANAVSHISPMTTRSSHPVKTPPTRPDRAWRPVMSTTTATSPSTSSSCALCNGEHRLQDCNDFKQMTIDDRWKFITDSKLCFACLSSRHQLKACKRKVKCSVPNCTRAHHSLLHAEPRHKTDETEHAVTHAAPVNVSICKSQVLLKVVPVIVSGAKGDVHTFALLDEGAALTLVESSLLERAGITGPTSPLHIRGATGMRTTETDSKIVSFNIRGLYESNSFLLSEARSVNRLNISVNSLGKNIVNRFPYLTDYVTETHLNIHDIELLIGQDNIDLIVTRQIIHGPTNGPMISRTNLGYVVHGKYSNKNIPTDIPVLHFCACEELTDALKTTFRTEDFGVRAQVADSPRSREDLRALEIMKETTKFTGDRWETGLLWRDDIGTLPDSRPQAHQRLLSIQRKMTLPKHAEFRRKYQEKIDDYLKKGYASKLTGGEADTRNDRTWYLPHFAVFNPNKPNKLRFVLDAAAKTNGKSLNDFLFPGPDYLNSLPGILLTFRCHRYAIMGDIQEMFHQVVIREDDRHAQRFLWENEEYQMNVMIFGAICSPSSAQYVKNVNAERYRHTHPRAVEAIVHRHYMDDFIDSVDTETDAVQLVDDVISIHKSGGFNMTSFMSNSMEVLCHLPAEKLSSSAVKVINDLDDPPVERVLGVHWDPKPDCFVFDLKFPNVPDDLKTGIKRPTKREILKMMMAVFDPLGFLLLVTMTARILLQDIWKLKIGWDDEVDANIFERWQAWISKLQETVSLRVSRWFLTPENDPKQPIQLHVFCDASSRAFAAVAYVRTIKKDDQVHVVLTLARGRVAPLKILSIPRLELQAAVLGARLATTAREHIDLPIDKIIFWSDSKTVLNWIRSDAGRFKPFVAHRISEISETTNHMDWRWVPSGFNPADDATRDSSPTDTSRWLNGPDFLREPEHQWPQEWVDDAEDSTDPEMKRIFLLTSISSSVPDDTRFSLYWRLIRSTAWILRFVHNVRATKTERRNGELCAEELNHAELLWIKESQKRSFAEDLELIKRNLHKSSKLYQLTPYVDSEGILRVGGRINNANVSEDTKHPIILHPSDSFVKLLIMQYHKDNAHVGKEQVLNNLRRRFWILRGRAAIRSSWTFCQTCKNKRALPQPPLMGQLPEERLTTNCRAFTVTGLDYFGPMNVKIGRRREKRYGALFTCMTVRAIHIELVTDLSASSAIMAIRRFIAKRGTPSTIMSDNATTFRGADRELRQAVSDIDQDQLQSFMSIRRIRWKFISPLSPHHGGCWERMVRSVKTTLRNVLKEQAPTEQVLLTVLAETESTINNRPLTVVPLDHNDSLPLTPNHFIHGMSPDNVHQSGSFSDRDLLRNSWRHAQRLADLVWKRWVREYLPTLTRRGRWFGVVEPLKVGDVVVLCDGDLPRNSWPKGIVERVFPAADGAVRVAEVRLPHGLFKRPVTKLAKLDVN